MPLRTGSAASTIRQNIHELTVNGSRPRSHAEVVAIALSEADKSRHRRAHGGGTRRNEEVTTDADIDRWVDRSQFPHASRDELRSMAETARVGARMNADYLQSGSHIDPVDLTPEKRPAYAFGGSLAGGGMGGGMGSGGLGGNMNANLGPTTPTVPSIGQAHTMPMPTVPRATLADGGAPAAEQAASLNEPYHQSGFLHSDVAGRTDRLPMSVPADSFVFPADTVSAMGQGNSLAGAKIMNAILDGAGPYGTRVRQRRAAGGMTGTGVSQVMLAGGELTADPNQLRNIGYRRRKAGTPNPPKDLAEGHKWAREMVDRLRAHQKKFLARAPKPKR